MWDGVVLGMLRTTSEVEASSRVLVGGGCACVGEGSVLDSSRAALVPPDVVRCIESGSRRLPVVIKSLKIAGSHI